MTEIKIKSQITDHRSQIGFTMIELMISVAIIAMIASISIVNFKAGERKKRVQLASDGVINAVRNAQNFTLTARQLSSSSCTISGLPDKSAIYFIMMFGAGNSQTLYGVDKCNNLLTVETYNYPGSIQVQANGYKLNGANVSALQFKFQTPFGLLTASTSTTANQGPFNSFTNANIIVETTGGDNSKTITIDGVSGKVE